MDIDYTNLRPDAIKDDIRLMCNEAMRHSFRGVCVLPYYVGLVNLLFEFEISTIIGFGHTCKQIKIDEALAASDEGATALDVMFNQAAFVNHEYLRVLKELTAIVQIGLPVKVNIGTCDSRLAYEIVKDSGAFCIVGNTIEIVKLWSGRELIIKVNDIQDYDTAERFFDAGAHIIGTTCNIMEKS